MLRCERDAHLRSDGSDQRSGDSSLHARYRSDIATRKLETHPRATVGEVRQFHAVDIRASPRRQKSKVERDRDGKARNVSVEFEKVLRVLAGGKVEFILVGGLAGIVHGSARATYDVDLVYSRTDENIERLVTALASYAPYLRDAPPGLPFVWDAKTIRGGLNFTLSTGLGDLDLFGELLAVGVLRNCWRIHSMSKLSVCILDVLTFRL